MKVSPNDSGMQLLGRFILPFDDRAVAAMALSHGVDAQPVSANYQCDPPQHGLLLGYAGLSDRASRAAIAGLRETFKKLEARLPAAPRAAALAEAIGSPP